MARALVVWTPIAACLATVVVLQEYFPSSVGLQGTLWWAAVLLLPVYVGFAAMFPSRPPHDQLLGTYLVPR